MYATKRSVRKASGINSEKHGDFNNKKITPGRDHRIQIIKDEHGFVQKVIKHYSARKLNAIHKYSEALAKYKAEQMAQNGEVPVLGADNVKTEAAVPEVTDKANE